MQSIGINLHLSYFRTVYGTGWETIVKPRLTALGVRHVRDAGTVEASDDWMQTVYGRMNELGSARIKFNLILKPAEGSTDYTRADHLDRLIQYAGASVESFEGLNEHDLSGRTNWVTEVRSFQKAIHAKLKSDARTAGLPLFGPAMAHPVNAPRVGDLSAYMNYGALHPYPGGSRPLATVSTHISYGRSINGSRPLVVTETGYHTAQHWDGDHPHIAEDAEARYVPRLYLDYFTAGFARTYLYELIDEGTSDTLREERFGLLRTDGTPKPAYASLRNLITVLADPGPAFTPRGLSFTLSGDTTNVRRLLLAKRDGRFYLVLWHDAFSWDLATLRTTPPSAKPVTLTLASAAGRIRTIAVLQSDQPAGEWTGATEVALVVPDSPLVIEITP
ncbi:MAG TPA: hypothetical protein VLD58_13385 [Gemmatimonadales bacterium]|nr:hypothetical protein [Gemmatimonadales bacterium]